MTADKQRPSAVDDDAGEGGVPVVLKAPGKVGSDSLQSPYDAEATYNAGNLSPRCQGRNPRG